MADARVRIQARSSPGAGRRATIHHDDGIGDLPDRLAFVALLPARLLARTCPAGSSPAPASSAHHSTEARRCSNCSTRAGARVRQPRLQRRILGPRAATSARRSSIDGARGGDLQLSDLELEPVSRQRIFLAEPRRRPTWAVTIIVYQPRTGAPGARQGAGLELPTRHCGSRRVAPCERQNLSCKFVLLAWHLIL